MTEKEVLNKIIPNPETEIPQSKLYFDKIQIYEKEKGKWYLKSWCSQERELLIYNEKTNKKAPEEIVRQLFLYELINKYGYPQKRIKTEASVQFGGDEASKSADIVVYQNDNDTPWLIVETKAPNKKNNIEQLKSYLNAKGSPIGIGYNGKNISRYIRPYPKEFDLLSDIPTEDEYQIAIKSENPIRKIKELIANRKWTIDELTKLNEEKQYDLREIIEELEELVLANSGQDSFEEIFKLIYTKLYDENKAITTSDKTLYFRDYSETKVTFEKITGLFENAKQYWRDVFEPTDKIKLTPPHLEACINKLQEVKLFGANLRIIDEAFEFLVTDVSKGKKGQYFTPRVVIDATVKMLNPTDQENILDPACGSAGFLIHAMEYVWDKYKLNEKGRSMYADRYLWGVDFDEKASKVSRAIMLIAGDGKTHIFKQNTLDYKNWDSKLIGSLSENWLVEDEKDPQKLKFDIVLSNPPFAGEINQKAIINNYNKLLGFRYTLSFESKAILKIFKDFAEEFELKYVKTFEKQIKSIVTELNKDKDIDFEKQDDINTALETIANLLPEIIEEGEAQEMLLRARLKNIKIVKKSYKWNKAERHILFIQRIIDSLKDGGRAVIVLPQGIFNNTTEEYIRKYIISKARILGVIGLHSNSFKPHTGTKTSLLLIRKYKTGENRNDYPIFFATSTLSFKDNSGRYKYVLDENESRVTDNKGNPLFETDIYDISQAFINFGIEQYQNGDTDFDFLKGLKKKIVKFEYAVVNLSNLGNILRLDSEHNDITFFKTREQIIKTGNYKKISSLFKIISSGRTPKEYTEFGIKVVRSGDLKDNRINYETLLSTLGERLFLLQPDDILISSIGKGSIGKVAINLKNEELSTVSEVTVLRDCNINAKFTAVFLSTKHGQNEFEREITGSTGQLHLLPSNMKSAIVPVFSDDFQKVIENSVITSDKLLDKSKQLYEEAKKILYKSLGIENWQTETKEINIKNYKYEIEKTENNVNISQIAKSRRLDAEYWQPKYEKAIEILTKREYKTINQIATLRKGTQARTEEIGDTLYASIKNCSNLEIETTETTNLDKAISAEPETLVLAITGATIGKVAMNIYNKKIAISGDLANISSFKISNYYLLVVLATPMINELCKRDTTGATNGHLSLSDIANYPIPILDDKIMTEISDKMKKSFKTRQKSKELIKISKQAVELAIEKDEKTAIKFIDSKVNL